MEGYAVRSADLNANVGYSLRQIGTSYGPSFQRLGVTVSVRTLRVQLCLKAQI